ncbi:MAG: peptide-methionine (R)-S-oxide reductase MsrB [Marinosulfonomonas sp.]|nr:peptide-methionine (R)-S-oxide reductase MsrB [Marinosulfonomonas sp.]
MDRRLFLTTSSATLAVAAFSGASVAKESFEVSRTKSEWQALLSKAQYNVMRNEGTERAGSSPLDKNYAEGTYLCRGCELPVYSSHAKFDSGTGWPSFWQSLPNAVETKSDRKFLRARTEVHCRRCGSHFGHIFNDGPKPTGKRHCLNGVSLIFQAA